MPRIWDTSMTQIFPSLSEAISMSIIWLLGSCNIRTIRVMFDRAATASASWLA